MRCIGANSTSATERSLAARWGASEPASGGSRKTSSASSSTKTRRRSVTKCGCPEKKASCDAKSYCHCKACSKSRPAANSPASALPNKRAADEAIDDSGFGVRRLDRRCGSDEGRKGFGDLAPSKLDSVEVLTGVCSCQMRLG